MGIINGNIYFVLASETSAGEADDRDSGGQTLSATMANIEQLSAAGHVDWEVNRKSICIH